MAIDFGVRFNELLNQVREILKTQHRGAVVEGTYIDQNQLINWQVKALHLISNVCGQDSQHFHAFKKNESPQWMGERWLCPRPTPTGGYSRLTSLRNRFASPRNSFSSDMRQIRADGPPMTCDSGR